eukprot:gene965-562_t
MSNDMVCCMCAVERAYCIHSKYSNNYLHYGVVIFASCVLEEEGDLEGGRHFMEIFEYVSEYEWIR